jgi:hypothetical protein
MLMQLQPYVGKMCFLYLKHLRGSPSCEGYKIIAVHSNGLFEYKEARDSRRGFELSHIREVDAFWISTRDQEP